MTENRKIFAAVKNDDDFEAALLSNVSTIFFLYPDIMELAYIARKAHEKNKKLFIHIDLTAGLGKDRSGIEFAKNSGVDGIISTRSNLIRLANEQGLCTIQRFFIVDSHSIDTTVEAPNFSKADMLEAMPGIAPKIIKKLRQKTNIPIIAGGIIETEEEVNVAIQSGACAISTGEQSLWSL